jgi:hypothetical protein
MNARPDAMDDLAPAPAPQRQPCNSSSTLKLSRIELEGFKSFRDHVSVGPLASFTCVVGPNGCGKSVVVSEAEWLVGARPAGRCGHAWVWRVPDALCLCGPLSCGHHTGRGDSVCAWRQPQDAARRQPGRPAQPGATGCGRQDSTGGCNSTCGGVSAVPALIASSC